MSAARGLTIEALTLRRAPGIEGGFDVTGLSAGVNVVYGPNASGKTTLARAITALLWPRTADTLTTLSGAFRADGVAWRVTLDAGHVTCQRDGQPADPPPFSATDLRDRYMLALHDLLAIETDNRDFADAILRESSGGYNVSQAMQALGFAARRPNTRADTQRHADAMRHTRQARDAQQTLRVDQLRQLELEQTLAQARHAAEQAGALQLALDYHAALAAHAEAQRALERFPAPVRHCVGDELPRLADMRARQATHAEQARDARTRLADAQQRLLDTRLGAAGLPPGLAQSARRLAETLRGQEADIAQLERELAETRATAHAEARRLGGALPPERLAALDRIDATTLSAATDLARRAEDARGRLAAQDELLSWLGDLRQVNDADRERLREAAGCLRRWLAEPVGAAPDTRRRWLLLAASVVIVEALVLAIVSNPIWLLAAVGGALLALTARAAHAPAAQDVAWRAQYERLGLPAPARWETAEVERTLSALTTQLATLDDAARRWEHWSQLPVRRAAQRAALDQLRAESAALAQHAGFAPNIDEAALAPLLAALERWQFADARAVAAEARLTHARAERATAARHYAALLGPWGYPELASAAEALGHADDLTVRQTDWQAANQAVADTTRLLADTLEPLLLEARREQDALFDALELPRGDDLALRTTLEQTPAYQQARADAARAELVLDTAERASAAWPAGRALEPAELREQLRAATERAEQIEPLRTTISDIRARLAEAGRGDALERALADEARQLDALRAARERALSSAAGAALGEWLREQTRDHDRPRVFHRARELFARVTQGRYELDMDDGQRPRFRARDTATGVGHGLQELSSGTRLQLLLAVRLAFVELQEQGPPLPLLLDETLGNSDESRARALIETVIQFAREGRQIFYFTAQHDEVTKWRALLAEHADVPHALVDLTRLRDYADWERLPLDAAPAWAPPPVPEPGELTYRAYGELLRVPALDVRVEQLGGAHVWHFLDDPWQLHHVLRQDVNTWGQLQSLLQHDGAGLLRDASLRPACELRARLYDAISASWRVGRGRTLTRAALRDSSAISEVFFIRVADLLDELDGDAAALLNALYAGRLQHFRANATALLRAFCDEHGYLDPAPRLTRDEARARIVAQFAGELRDNTLTLETINMAIAALWRER